MIKEMTTTEFIPDNWTRELDSIIKVIGVGGGGNNAVNNMFNNGIKGVNFVVCNTDKQALIDSPVPVKIQIGKELTEGLGAGCDPVKGKQAAEENINEIRSVLEKNTKMVFIAAGMGGGTGTGAAPIIAQEAKSMGILTVSIVTLPYRDEGEEQFNRALNGLNELKMHVDSLLVINNQKIYEIYPKLPLMEAFLKADEVIATAARSIAELITNKGYINVDFADVKRFMTNSGMALMGLGHASGEHRAVDAVKNALNSPLLNDNDIKGAKNILINVTSSSTQNPIIAHELEELMDHIRIASGGRADCKRGVVFDEAVGEDVYVTIIATGFKMNVIVETIENIENVGDEDIEIIHLSEDGNYAPNNISSYQVKNIHAAPYRTSPELLEPENPNAKNIDLEIPAYERFNIQLNIKNNVQMEDETFKSTIVETNGKLSVGENKYLDRKLD